MIINYDAYMAMFYSIFKRDPVIFSATNSKLGLEEKTLDGNKNYNPFEIVGFTDLIAEIRYNWEKIITPIIARGEAPIRSSKITELLPEEDVYLSLNLFNKDKENVNLDHTFISRNFRIFVLDSLNIDFDMIYYFVGNKTPIISIFIGNQFESNNDFVLKFGERFFDLIFYDKFRDKIPIINSSSSLSISSIEHDLIVTSGYSDIATIRFVTEYFVSFFRVMNIITFDDPKITFDDIMKFQYCNIGKMTNINVYEYFSAEEILEKIYEYCKELSNHGTFGRKTIRTAMSELAFHY